MQRGVKTGDGLKNTQIPATKGSPYEAASAVYDKDLYGNRYTDWFIPDRKELNLLHESIKSGKLNPELFRAKYYWSSSEDGDSTAWKMFLLDGISGRESRTSFECMVRPVRSFK